MPISTATNTDQARELLADAPSPVVVIPVYESYDDVVQCLDSVTTHTSCDTAILIVDDGGADRRFLRVLETADLDHHIVVLQNVSNQGFVRSCNLAFTATAGHDVVLLNSDVIVGPEWLGRLTEAALSDDTVATATSLSNHGGLLSVPYRNRPTPSLPEGMTPHEAAERVAAGSLRLRPTIPTATGHCCYIRRTALDLIGGFDEQFSPGYGEEVDWSQRAVAHGFRHVCADDVFTYHRGNGTFGVGPEVVAGKQRHDAVVAKRYPWFMPWVGCVGWDQSSPLADAIDAARRALVGIEIGIDALSLGSDRMENQLVVETIRTLARRKEIKRLVAFVPMHPPPCVAGLAEELNDVEFISINPLVDRPDEALDLVYRPCRVNSLAELDFMYSAGGRFVVNQLDAIPFQVPDYHPEPQVWVGYRDLQRLTLQLAHGVAFVSDHSRRAALAEGLIDDTKPSAVVSCGISGPDSDEAEQRPASLLADVDGFLLCLGASYLHENRRFALEVWAELRRRGWRSPIVLAGPTPPSGSSLAREAEFLLGRPGLRADVHTLASITEPEKQWLLGHAALVLYPSVVGGSGLAPFEAALHGVPVLTTRQGSMDETLPTDIPTLDGFDVSRAADQAWALLHDEDLARDIVDALRERSRQFDWARTGDLLIDLFQEVLRRPRGRVLVIEGERDAIGLASRSQRLQGAEAPNVLERIVGGVISRKGLKHRLSPDGSRRQLAARNVISQARRRLNH